MSNTKTKNTGVQAVKRSAGKKAPKTAVATGGAKAAKGEASNQSSKHDQILALLRHHQGASLEEMQKVSGWQPHSVRGFLSGTVKKKLGLKLSSAKDKDGERRYSVRG